MKKILVSLMAVAMLLSMTACGKKCAYCDEKIDGKGYEPEGEKYCNELCAAADALANALG